MVSLLLIVLSVWELICPGSEPSRGALCHCSASAALGSRLAVPALQGWGRQGQCRAAGSHGSMSVPAQLRALSCLVMGWISTVPRHDELLCFSAGAITTDFCVVERTLRLTVCSGWSVV